MAFDPSKLAAALRDPTIAGKSDADAAAALSIVILKPRTDPVTYSTAGAALGAAKAIALSVALTTAAASSSPLASAAKFVDALMSGPGFSATNPDVATIGAEFVSNGILSQADFTALLNTTSYRCDGTVAAADVTAARALAAKLATIAVLRSQVNAGSQAAFVLLGAAASAGPVPSPAQLQAAMAAKVTG